MQLYVINPGVHLTHRRLSNLFGITVVSVSLLMGYAALSSDSNSQIFSSEPLADDNDVAKDSNGPTMIMSYSKEKFVENPITSFMYFVPLIAPTLVDNISSVNNEQQVGVISHKMTVKSKSFRVVCEFEILGSGFHINTFDSAGMIVAHTDELKKGETLTNMLDYIKFDGYCYGVIEVKGRITVFCQYRYRGEHTVQCKRP